MLNLVSMIVMCILIVGVLIVTFVIYLEGSLSVDPIIFVHMTIPGLVLTLNLYVIMCTESEEEMLFKNSKKGTRKGIFLINFAMIASVLGLAVAVYMKFNTNRVVSSEDDQDYDESGMDDSSLQVMFIEECLLHALAVIETVTLREYARAKIKDIIDNRKGK